MIPAEARDVTVIGGQDIFAQCISATDRLEVTRVHASPQGDTFFPAIDPGEWTETARVDHAPGAGDEGIGVLGVHIGSWRREHGGAGEKKKDVIDAEFEETSS